MVSNFHLYSYAEHSLGMTSWPWDPATTASLVSARVLRSVRVWQLRPNQSLLQGQRLLKTTFFLFCPPHPTGEPKALTCWNIHPTLTHAGCEGMHILSTPKLPIPCKHSILGTWLYYTMYVRRPRFLLLFLSFLFLSFPLWAGLESIHMNNMLCPCARKIY